MKRTDIVKDVDGDAHYFFHYVQQNNSIRLNPRRQFDRNRRQEYCWDAVALMHPNAAGFRVKMECAHALTQFEADDLLEGRSAILCEHRLDSCRYKK